MIILWRNEGKEHGMMPVKKLNTELDVLPSANRKLILIAKKRVKSNFGKDQVAIVSLKGRQTLFYNH